MTYKPSGYLNDPLLQLSLPSQAYRILMELGRILPIVTLITVGWTCIDSKKAQRKVSESNSPFTPCYQYAWQNIYILYVLFIYSMTCKHVGIL